MVNIRKCAVIGCGFVGATCAYSLLHSGIFSELVLIDVNREKASGEAMDLTDSLPYLSPASVYAGDYSDIGDCSVVIITAGANQKPGETRLDLVKKNSAIIGSIVKEVVKYNTDGILLVVSNPVDILTYVTLKLSEFPASRVIGSGTVLDTARLKQLVGEHLSVDPRNVHSFVIGEHGDSELAVWSSANVSGVDLIKFCSICGKCGGMQNLYRLFDDVRDSAYKIINTKGATYYGIAESVRRICEAIVRDEDSILPVSVLLNGEYDIENICLGMPSVIGRSGVKRTFEVPLDDYELKKLRASADAVRAVISQLRPDEVPVL